MIITLFAALIFAAFIIALYYAATERADDTDANFDRAASGRLAYHQAHIAAVEQARKARQVLLVDRTGGAL